MRPSSKIPWIILLFIVMTVGCVPVWGTQSSLATPDLPFPPTNTPFLPLEYTPLATVTRAKSPTLTPVVQTLWISPATPKLLIDEMVRSGYSLVENPEMADSTLDINWETSENFTSWIYALVAPFPTIIDAVSISDVEAAWFGTNQGILSDISLYMDEPTFAGFYLLWGAPGADSVRIVNSSLLLATAWNEQLSFAIVPFEDLNPRWKVLEIDGQSPIHKDFDPDIYPLKISFTLQPPAMVLPLTNRDPQKLTVLIMTGVTALVRSTAGRMVTKGLTYPGEEIRDTFRAADLLHISNEVPFFEDCPHPYPLQESLVFCSDPSYIALLEDIGTDIVELTGNHFQDYGSTATLFTIDMYDERGWIYFGGGRDMEDAQKAALVERNGNKLAFIGCNPAGPASSWAGINAPGSAECDMEYMTAEIARLRADGYLPIVTFQHIEYYTLWPSVAQINDFRYMVDAGAAIVSGSQSHFPQYMEFYGGAYIHYGLGNLFFDQMDYPVVGTRREFVDRHVFYDGHHISTELLTYMLEDYSRPRPMLDWERRQFLQEVFAAAGWE